MEHMWAPWRMDYVTHEKSGGDGCFLCQGWAEASAAAAAEKHLVAGRSALGMVILNRFPYNCGHLMVVPARHIAAGRELTADEAVDLWRLVSAAQEALDQAMRPDGFNIGINQGRAGGAGLAGHLHIHVVPRWDGDHNFMTVCADTRVVPEALAETRRRLAPLLASRGYGS